MTDIYSSVGRSSTTFHNLSLRISSQKTSCSNVPSAGVEHGEGSWEVFSRNLTEVSHFSIVIPPKSATLYTFQWDPERSNQNDKDFPVHPCSRYVWFNWIQWTCLIWALIGGGFSPNECWDDRQGETNGDLAHANLKTLALVMEFLEWLVCWSWGVRFTVQNLADLEWILYDFLKLRKEEKDF